MIPKVIHYCWFGNAPKPNSVLQCIESWKYYCPDYEIREWTEKNVDIAINQYSQQAYEAKAWGFVPDYLRLWIIYNHGGIYLDTDVQVIRSFDELMVEKAFAGFEKSEYKGGFPVALGLGFGAEKHNHVIYEHMKIYETLKFRNDDGSFNRIPSPHYTTDFLIKHALDYQKNETQRLDGITIFPTDFFCPKSFSTGVTEVTANTYCIHHFDASWYTPEQQDAKNQRWEKIKRKKRKRKLRSMIRRSLVCVFGERLYTKLRSLFVKQ